MSIASMEDLSALPVGTKVRVDALNGSNSWVLERTEQGWMKDKVLVLPDMLVGYVAEKRVIDLATAGPSVGEWWQGASYWYLIRKVDEHQIHTLRWRRRSPQTAPIENVLELRSWLNYGFTHIDPPQALGTIEVVMGFINLWQNAEERLRVQTEENRALKNRPDPEPLRREVDAARTAIERLRVALTNDAF